ncbi:MAG TPA: hypothetical protein DHW07_00760 [Gammaproteobacteria bacterium]|nr:hypothetical protein [Gammaproteobacteria bacterium]
METPAEPPFNLKHRATGALILLAIPVVMLPWLLAGQPGAIPVNSAPAVLEPTGQFVSSIQTTSKASDTAPAPDGAKDPTKTTDDTPAPDATRKPIAPPSTDAQPESGWVVRVGVFSEPANLEKRSTLLLANDMTPRHENIDINGLTAVRIYLGPFPDLATAERESGKAMLVTGEPAFVVELP